MVSKHPPHPWHSFCFLFVFCLPSYGDDARQPSDGLVTITPEQTERDSRKPRHGLGDVSPLKST